MQTPQRLVRKIASTLAVGLAFYACQSDGVTRKSRSTGPGGQLNDPKTLPSGYHESREKGGWITVTHGDARRLGDRKLGRFGAGTMAKEAAAAPPGVVAPRRRGPGRFHHTVVQRVGPLKAGEVDDNQAFADYLRYHRKNAPLIPAAYRLDISERYLIDVTDAAGKPVPNASVTISAGEKALMTGLTDAAGRLRFFPLAVGTPRQVTRFEVTFRYRGETLKRSFARSRAKDRDAAKPAGQGDKTVVAQGQDWRVSITGRKQVQPVTLEVVFLLDTTGSMSDEIAQVQRTLLAITEKIRRMPGQPRIRYGMVLYRDRGDAYVTKRFGFTEDVQAFDRALRTVRANGGGDMPESMNMGLHAAVNQMEWSANALRLAFLVADAPPHMDYSQDVRYSDTLKRAVAKGIKIFPTAASGLDARGSYVMRQIAQYTGGRFLFIEYGQSGASHGITGSYATNNLDDIIVRIVRRELSAYAG